MFFKTKVECSFYRSTLVIVTCLSISSQPQEDKGLNNTLGNCNSTMMTNGNCSGFPRSPLMNSTSNVTNGTEEEYNSVLTDKDFFIINIAIMTVSSVGVLCNVLLITAITVDPLKILRRGAWITILNLAVADFIACAGLFFEMFFYQIEDWEIINLVMEEVIFFRMYGQSASFMLLTLLTIEIYVIIKYPMKSRVMVTKRKAVQSCAMVWLLAIGSGLCEISFVWSDSTLYYFIANIAVLELAVAIQVVLKIFIAVEISSSRRSILNVETLNKKQRDVAKTVMILNAILIVTAFPYFLAKQIEYVDRLDDSSDQRSLLQKFAYYYEPVALLNFVLNPIFYSLRLQDYRRSLLALFKCNGWKRWRRINSTSQQRSSTGGHSTTEVTKL